MDILNFISWIKGGRQVTTVDATRTLIPLGLKDNRRDDGYLAGAITVQDFVDSLPIPTTPTLQEVLDNNHDLVNGNNFQGTGAGVGVLSTGGTNVNAFGIDASATNSTITEVNAFGFNAAINNQGNYVNAFGYRAADSNIKDNVNAIGNTAAQENEGSEVNAIGTGAGYQNQGSKSTFMGQSAGRLNKGDECVFLGTSAGEGNKVSNVIGLGAQSAVGNQLANMFIVSKDYLPQYADRPAAAAAINVGTGAVANQFYFYWDISGEVIRAIIT